MPSPVTEPESAETWSFQDHRPERKRSKGEIRIRSNICIRPDAWHLVPGDLLEGCDIPPHQITDKQRDEMMYYVPCCICHRTIFQIHEEGCDHPECRRQGIPSRAEAERKKAMVEAGQAGPDPISGPDQATVDFRQPPK